MSWFNRKPRPKNPPSIPHPKKSSPSTEKYVKEMKEQVRQKEEK
jgi:hypothetical protein